MDKSTLQEIAALWDKINDLERKLSNYTDQKDEALKADIDYVAIMTDTYVEEEEEPVNEEQIV